MSQFETVPFEEAFVSIPVGKLKIKESEYNPTGSICVVDQGQNFVSGMTTRAELLREDGPYIVFGDHTRVVKYIDFPFVVGADGVRLYKASEKYEPEFLYLFLTNSKLPEDGYGRHSKYLKELLVPAISKEKQRQIAARLKAQLAEVDKARQAAEAQLRDADVLATAIRREIERELFSKADIRLFGSYVKSYRNGFGKRPKEGERGPIVLRIADVSSGFISIANPRYGEVSEKEAETYKLENGDLLFIRVNGAKEIVGKCCVVDDTVPEDTIFNDHLIRVQITDELNPDFARLCVSLPRARQLIEEVASTSAGQLTINQQLLDRLEIPVYSFDEQIEAVSKLQTQLDQLAVLRETTSNRIKDINLLPQKILAQAFEM